MVNTVTEATQGERGFFGLSVHHVLVLWSNLEALGELLTLYQPVLSLLFTLYTRHVIIPEMAATYSGQVFLSQLAQLR